MDPGEEMHPAVRPKRQTRPPTRLLDYVVDPMGYQPRDPSPWRPPPLSPLFCGSFPGDAAHPETPQLAPGHFQSTLLTPPPEHPYQPVPYQDSSLPMEIKAIREESAKLYQSQQWIQSGLKELKEVRAEMKELIQVARSLKMEIASSPGSQSPVRPPHALVAAPSAASHPRVEPEEVWPDPPPWPELEGDLQSNMQHLKIERDSNQPYYPPKEPVHDPLWPPPPPPHPFPSASYGDQRHSPPALTRHCPPAFTIPPPRQAPTYRTPLPVSEQLYRGPQPTIPKFINPDPSEFARLRIALENLLPANTSELFRYQILVDHLRLEEAKLIADAYLNSPTPYTDTMVALHEKFGQPHQLALRKIASVLEAPEVRRGDIAAFQRFALQIQSLVGLLQTLGPDGEVELNCGSHVARLLGKLPAGHAPQH